MEGWGWGCGPETCYPLAQTSKVHQAPTALWTPSWV